MKLKLLFVVDTVSQFVKSIGLKVDRGGDGERELILGAGSTKLLFPILVNYCLMTWNEIVFKREVYKIRLFLLNVQNDPISKLVLDLKMVF